MNLISRSAIALGAVVLAPIARAQMTGTPPVPATSIATPATITPSAASIAAPAPATATAPAATDPDAPQQQRLQQAMSMIRAGQVQQAIDGPDAEVLAYFDKQYGGKQDTRYYAARTQQEALLYASMAASQKEDAVVLPATWAQAWFIKGSALNSLGRYAEAVDALQHALALSPWNAMYETELAYSYEEMQQTEKALAACRHAEVAAAFSPDDTRVAEQTRALRCEGFNLTNLQRYDDAIKVYQDALTLDPEDAKSKHELEYIRQVRH